MNNSDLRTREVLEQVVREEIDRIPLQTKDIVREVVKATLLPKIRQAIHECVPEVVEEILAEEMLSMQEAKICEDISGIIPDLPTGEPEEVLVSHEEHSVE